MLPSSHVMDMYSCENSRFCEKANVIASRSGTLLHSSGTQKSSVTTNFSKFLSIFAVLPASPSSERRYKLFITSKFGSGLCFITHDWPRYRLQTCWRGAMVQSTLQLPLHFFSPVAVGRSPEPD